jgi:hypothetical protein
MHIAVVGKFSFEFWLTWSSRYTDFLVNEIALDGTVVHLTDDRAPNFKATSRVSFTSCLSSFDEIIVDDIPTPRQMNC